MMVMMIANTASLNASSRPLPMVSPGLDSFNPPDTTFHNDVVRGERFLRRTAQYGAGAHVELRAMTRAGHG